MTANMMREVAIAKRFSIVPLPRLVFLFLCGAVGRTKQLNDEFFQGKEIYNYSTEN